MEIKIVRNPISRKKLIEMAEEQFGDLVKAVVDIKQEIMAVGGEFHSDEEVVLMEQQGSKRKHTWGINLYPKKKQEDWIEFDSIINLKPFFDNRSRNVEKMETRKKIKEIVQKLVTL